MNTPPQAMPTAQFRHEALFYSGPDEFVDATVPFLRDGIVAGEPALVVVDAAKIATLKSALAADATAVFFADMADVGTNPARIIPAWQQFVDRYAAPGRSLRGIGEPIFPERGADEMVECQRHEALLNVAFDAGPSWRLLCPYDTNALSAEVISEAKRSHPFLLHGAEQTASSTYMGTGTASGPWDSALREPAQAGEPRHFDMTSLRAMRQLISRTAAQLGLSSARIPELVMAANEVADNSLRHGGAGGAWRMWTEGGTVVCEIRGAGELRQPLADRTQPSDDISAGRGLWLANQLSDLVQIRVGDGKTVVRMHVRANS